MKDELKPCPCCGWKRPDLKEGQRGSTKGVYLWCSSCGLTTRLFTYDPIITSGRTLAVGGARNAWNTRTVPETPSPDVMEVWREARRAWRSGPAIVRDEETNSVRIGDREAAATVIAEAKARWLAEKDAEIARLRAVMQQAIETLSASRHLIGKYTPDHHWLPEHDQRIGALKDAIKEPKP